MRQSMRQELLREVLVPFAGKSGRTLRRWDLMEVMPGCKSHLLVCQSEDRSLAPCYQRGFDDSITLPCRIDWIARLFSATRPSDMKSRHKTALSVTALAESGGTAADRDESLQTPQQKSDKVRWRSRPPTRLAIKSEQPHRASALSKEAAWR